MKKDIILSGVGGQGILSIAAVIGEAAMAAGLHIKQAEVHGMSQRGGDVHSNLRISSRPVHSDLIARGSADLIISLEPMEALRYLPWLAGDGWVVASSAPFVNIPNYPDHGELLAELRALPRAVVFDVDVAAREAEVARAANIVLLGAAAAATGLDPEALRQAVRKIFGRKGDAVVEMNLVAFETGLAVAVKNSKI
ncbi:MAG: indolepyruvate oxidoreductase subunit beta [Alistipes sp.]|jgi:indolepyruvate ferredoxin oxidoreductase beta subunit|nr:indolepyruvate oxidoreductase subunit beta [Alistipes sp.]